MTEKEWTIIEALNWASSFLGQNTNAGELLLAHHLKCDRNGLLMQLRERCEFNIVQSFQKDVMRHKEGIPVQYILGKEQFYSRTFSVDERVLIPRPETEELVELVLLKINEHFFDYKAIQVCDIGTGSGAIAITLALEEPKVNMTAVDISEKALQVAQKNATDLHATVRFLQGDLLTPLLKSDNKFDVLVSNPPYIETSTISELQPVVRDNEPHLALDGGVDGYDYYRQIIGKLPAILNKRALVAFEVGIGQAQTVSSLLSVQFPKAKVTITYDINKKERIVSAEIGR